MNPTKLSRPAAGLALLLGFAALQGCRQPEDPRGYSRERPPADRLDKRDKGLQSYDVLAAADQMAESLLSLPELNASQTKYTVVVDRAENLTSTYNQSLDIFLRQLRVELFRQGKDRVQLVTNRAKLRDLQSRELEQPGAGEREDFGGAGSPGGRTQPGPAGIQPDYSLYVQVSDLPNRGTNFYQFVFTLSSLQTRQDVWTDAYDVRVAR